MSSNPLLDRPILYKEPMQKQTMETRQRAVLAAVQLPSVSDVELQTSVDELRDLAKTLGFEVVGTFIQKRDKFDMTAYLGIGKRREMRRFVENKPESEDESEPDADAEDACLLYTSDAADE